VDWLRIAFVDQDDINHEVSYGDGVKDGENTIKPRRQGHILTCLHPFPCIVGLLGGIIKIYNDKY
jgi:hypothetical protein